MNFNPYSDLLFVLSFGMLSLFIYSLFQKRNRLSAIFSFLCLVMATYSFFYAFELASVSLESIQFFLKLEYFGVAFIPVFWFLLAYRFRFQKSYDIKIILIVFFIPFLTLAISSTNEFHHLLYKEISVIKYKTLYVAELKKGTWYIVSSAYSYLALVSGQILFFKTWRESKSNKKIQAKLLFIGSVFPLVLSVIYLMGFTPGKIDPMPLSYMIVSLFYYTAVFKYDFLEMKEVIRETSFEQINEGIIVTDNKGRLIDFNNTSKTVFSCININNIGLNLKNLSEFIYSENKTLYEVKHKGKYYEFRTTLIKENQKISGKIYIFQDITEKKAMLNKLQYNAKYDFLSQVYNRHELFELAEIELYKSQRYKRALSLLMLDIDFFKKINDTYGHIAGDIVIKELSAKCRERLRPSDIIGRYGGEEFLILLTETPLVNAVVIAEDIRNIIEKSEILFEDKRIKITISIGVASSSGLKKIELEELINNGDKALYLAKNNGRNRIEIFE